MGEFGGHTVQGHAMQGEVVKGRQEGWLWNWARRPEGF